MYLLTPLYLVHLYVKTIVLKAPLNSNQPTNMYLGNGGLWKLQDLNKLTY